MLISHDAPLDVGSCVSFLARIMLFVCLFVCLFVFWGAGILPRIKPQMLLGDALNWQTLKIP